MRSTLLLLGVNIPAGKGEHTAVMKSPPLFETVHQRIYRNENAILSKKLVTAVPTLFKIEAACSKPHKHASSKACAEHMHRWLLQSASWHLAKLYQAHSQQHSRHNKMLDLACDIRNELTNAVQTTFTKAGVVHTKVFCVRDLYTKRGAKELY